MKKIIFIVISVVMLISCNNNTQKTTLEEENLRGPVKSVKTSIFEAEMKFGDANKDDYICEGWYKIDFGIFSHISNLLYQYNIMIYGDHCITEFLFSKNGFIEIINSYDEDFDLQRKTTYKWENGNILNIIRYDEDNVDDFETYKYEDNKLIEKMERRWWWNECDTLKTKYTIDKKGNIIEEISYNEEGLIGSKHKYTFKNNKKTKEEYEWYAFEKELKYKTTNEYVYKNGKLNKIIRNFTSSDDSFYNTDSDTIYYNKREQIIKIASKDSEEIRTYNQIGDVEIISKSNEEDIIFKYEYDNYNNWTKVVIYENVKPKYIVEREIEYY